MGYFLILTEGQCKSSKGDDPNEAPNKLLCLLNNFGSYGKTPSPHIKFFFFSLSLLAEDRQERDRHLLPSIGQVPATKALEMQTAILARGKAILAQKPGRTFPPCMPCGKVAGPAEPGCCQAECSIR